MKKNQIIAHIIGLSFLALVALNAFAVNAAGLPDLLPCDGACIVKIPANCKDDSCKEYVQEGVGGKEEKCKPCNFKALIALANNLLKYFIYILFIFVVFLIAKNGFQYLTAQGDRSKVEGVKKAFTNIGIGLFWMLAGWLVVKFVLIRLVDTAYILLQ